MKRAATLGLAAAALLGGCASQTTLLLPGESGHPVGALVKLNKDGSECALNEPNEAIKGGCSIRHNVNVKPEYNALIAGLPLPYKTFSIRYAVGDDVPLRNAEYARFLEDIRTEIAIRPGAEVQVTGHTDSTGGPNFDNVGLSERRAEKFRDILVRDDHFPADQVTVAWRGDLEPFDPAHPGDNDANRRIEVIVR